MENNHRRGSVAIAFLIGAVAGGVTALLFAPQTGSQMRGRLKRGARDLHRKGEHLAHEAQDTAEVFTGAMKGAASEARNTYRDEREKRRAASGMETKRYGETETADNKPRVGT